MQTMEILTGIATGMQHSIYNTEKNHGELGGLITSIKQNDDVYCMPFIINSKTSKNK